jgi:GNAT superfamily N-acetyltransferase
VNAHTDIAWSRVSQVSRLPGGERIIIRVVRPQDADALQGYFRGLSNETRYRRFLGAIAELTPKQLARLIAMDGSDELALLAFAETGETPCLVAEAVLVTSPESTRGEFAISVADTWQHRGVGTALVRDLECRARMRGARYLYGDVLRTNTAMKNLARKAGFAVRSPFTDARLIEISKDLSVSASDLPCRERFAQFLPLADRVNARFPAAPA